METKTSGAASGNQLFDRFLFFGGRVRGRDPTKIDYREKGTLIPTSLLEDLEEETVGFPIYGAAFLEAVGFKRRPKGKPPVLCASRGVVPVF